MAEDTLQFSWKWRFSLRFPGEPITSSWIAEEARLEIEGVWASIRNEEYDLNGFDSNFLIESFPFLFKNTISDHLDFHLIWIICYSNILVFRWTERFLFKNMISNFLIIECSSFLKNVIFGSYLIQSCWTICISRSNVFKSIRNGKFNIYLIVLDIFSITKLLRYFWINIAIS